MKIPKVTCLFCEEKMLITACTRIGKKQVCNDCMQRLIEMIEFHKPLTYR